MSNKETEARRDRSQGRPKDGLYKVYPRGGVQYSKAVNHKGLTRGFSRLSWRMTRANIKVTYVVYDKRAWLA